MILTESDVARMMVDVYKDTKIRMKYIIQNSDQQEKMYYLI